MMDQSAESDSHVKGWSIDADPNNNPTYPIQRRLPADVSRSTWERPTQQPMSVEVLMSIERPNMTAVFGTSTPPTGISGNLRRVAFRYSESSYLHWLPLVLADRVNMVEGIVDDLRRGYVPNLFVELGGKAEWKYNRATLVRRLLVGTLLISAAIGYVRYTRSNMTPPRSGERAQLVNRPPTNVIDEDATTSSGVGGARLPR